MGRHIEEAKPEVAYSTWTVKDRTGKVVRAYTIADHGEVASACATGYAGKIGGSVIAS